MEYKTVHVEYVHLQDQFYEIVADHMLIRYQLQGLIINTAHAHDHARSQRVRGLVDVVASLLMKFSLDSFLGEPHLSGIFSPSPTTHSFNLALVFS